MSEMSPAEEVFFTALEKATLAARAAYLDEACAGNPALRARVEKLLAAHHRVGGFLDSVAAQDLTCAYSPEGKSAVSDALSAVAETVVAGKYKLLEQIGEGGMGTVWMAEQQQPMRRLVALKLIKAGMDSAQVFARFEAERQALALMDHPNIARVLDAGTAESGHPYFVMELIRGTPITQFCDEHRLSPRQRLELFVPICQAVQHAHQKGIIHRDLKPSNILVTNCDGTPVPKVIDFGVAKATGQKLTERTLFTGFGALIGTLEFMSPEQAELNALDIDTRSDIYSLGVLLYLLLTGSTPLTQQRLEKTALTDVLRLIREEEPPMPSLRLSTSEALPLISVQRQTEPAKLTRLVQGELDWIAMKCLEKDRTRRYETANGLARDVQRHLNNEPIEAGKPSRWYKVRKFFRQHGVVGVIGGFMLATYPILLLLVIFFYGSALPGALREKQENNSANNQLKLALMVESENSVQRESLQEFYSRSMLMGDSGLRRIEDGPKPDPDLRWRTVLDRAVQRLESRTGMGLIQQASWGRMNSFSEIRVRVLFARAYEEVGEQEKARGLREKARDLSRERIEPMHKALETARTIWGDDHPFTHRNALELANLYLWLRDYEQAERMYLVCYQQLEVPPPPPSLTFGSAKMNDAQQWLRPLEYPIQLSENLEGLVQLYEDWGKKDKANEWRKKLENEKATARAAAKP